MLRLVVHVVMMLSVLTRSQYTTDARLIFNGPTTASDVTAKGQNGIRSGKPLLVKKVAPVGATGFDEFRDEMKKKLKVSDELLELPDVEKWFEKEFTFKKKEFNLQDPTQFTTAERNLSTIWCSYCQRVKHCLCIRQYCFNVNC